MVIELLIIFVILFVGSFVQGVSGFGFGLLAMSFLPFFFSIKDSTLLVVSLAIVTSLSHVLQMRHHIQLKKIAVLLAAAFFGRVAAFFILNEFGDMDFLKNILGVFLVGVVIYLFRSESNQKNKEIKYSWLAIVLGFLGGIFGGVFAVGGPFLVFYFMMLFSQDKYAYSANLQMAFLFSSWVTIVMHGINGDFTSIFFLYFLIGVVSVVIGSRIGILCFAHISQKNLKKVAGVVVAIAAINLILFS